jgi:hypothetical protein
MATGVLSPNASVSFAVSAVDVSGQQYSSSNAALVLVERATDLSRCRRLNKECHPGETVRRRSSRRPAVSKANRLEEKLDSTVSLIKAGAQTNTVTPNQSNGNSVSSNMNDSFPKVAGLMPTTSDQMGSLYSLSPSGFDDIGLELSLADAEENIANFQTFKSKYFPFLNIPSATRAQERRQQQPFLWLFIMAVSSKSTLKQQVLASKTRQTIA